MTIVSRCLLLSAIFQIVFFSAASRADSREEKHGRVIHSGHLAETAWSPDHDMAFVSVRGSRPDANRLKGFERAVLYTARGEVVRKLTLRGDSIYCLDKMIQDHKSRGPLFVRMYRK